MYCSKLIIYHVLVQVSTWLDKTFGSGWILIFLMFITFIMMSEFSSIIFVCNKNTNKCISNIITKKSNLSTFIKLRISFCEILYYIASFLSKINNILFSWLVSRSPLNCEFSGSVLVFWQHCGKYVTDFATYTVKFD